MQEVYLIITKNKKCVKKGDKMGILQLISTSNFITVNKDLIKELGLEEAILLGELASEYDYWNNKNEIEDGYFYSTIENIEEKTTLTAYKQRKCLENLKNKGIIDIQIRGIPAKRYIKINEEQVFQIFNNKLLKNLTTRSENFSQQDIKKLNGNNNIINNNINNNIITAVEKKQNAEITKCYEENIGLITPATAEILFSYNDIDYKMIIEAIKIASVNNKRNCRYIQGILNSWISKGYKVLADIQNEQKEKQKTVEEKKETKEETIARWKKEWGLTDED